MLYTDVDALHGANVHLDARDDLMLARFIFQRACKLLKFPPSMRMCVDYRALNKIMKSDIYSLPRINGILDDMADASVFPRSTCNRAITRF